MAATHNAVAALGFAAGAVSVAYVLARTIYNHIANNRARQLELLTTRLGAQITDLVSSDQRTNRRLR